MSELTKEQHAQLKVWATQRDAFLLEIQALRSTKESLQTDNKQLAASNSDIVKRMLTIQGRVEELKVRESELPPLMLKEVAVLETKKRVLESEITTLGKMIDILVPQKSALESDIEKAQVTFQALTGGALLLDKVVDRVTVVSKDNTEKINLLVTDLATSLEEIVSVNRKNVSETNVVIEKLPAMLMEVQRHGLIKPRQSIIKSKD